MKLKICGLKNPKNILEVSTLLPDFIGFIFYEKSARYFDGAIPEIPKTIKKTGVFVDADLETILSKIEKYNLDVVQLHGNESPELCQSLKLYNVEVIKAFPVQTDFDFGILKRFEDACDYFLFDTKGENPGGNGTAFNWEILKNYPSSKPFFLSGGIGPDDIQKIKNLDLPIFAIDVNSRFETEPGYKNVTLLKQFKSQLS